LFSGHFQPNTIGYFVKENPHAHDEKRCPLRESFDQEQRPKSRNSVTAITGIRAESWPDCGRGVHRSWCVGCQRSETATRCTDGGCQKGPIRHGYCLEVRPVCPKCSASGSSPRRVSFAGHSLHQPDRVHRHINADGPHGVYGPGCCGGIGAEFDLRTCGLGSGASTKAGQATGPAEDRRRSRPCSQTPEGRLECPRYCSEAPGFQVDRTGHRDRLSLFPTHSQHDSTHLHEESCTPAEQRHRSEITEQGENESAEISLMGPIESRLPVHPGDEEQVTTRACET